MSGPLPYRPCPRCKTPTQGTFSEDRMRYSNLCESCVKDDETGRGSATK